MKNFFCLIIITAFLTGCLFDSGSTTIVDDYTINWIDTEDTRSLSKREGLIGPYVFASGYNAKYVYAKQYPTLTNKSIVNYYIIERTNNIFQDKPVYGPMQKIGFDTMCIKLNIIKPEFDIEYNSPY